MSKIPSPQPLSPQGRGEGRFFPSGQREAASKVVLQLFQSTLLVIVTKLEHRIEALPSFLEGGIQKTAVFQAILSILHFFSQESRHWHEGCFTQWRSEQSPK
jgi:hypothetical protein